MQANIIPHYINGQFITVAKHDNFFKVENPAKPSETLANVAWKKDLVEMTMTSLHEAQKHYFQHSYEKRENLFLTFCKNFKNSRDEIKNEMMRELARSEQSVTEELALIDKFFAILPSFFHEQMKIHEPESGWGWQFAPIGHILISTNVALPVYHLVTAALTSLLSGNGACIMPSLHCLLSSSLLAKLFHDSGFPAGTVQFVYGDFEVLRRFVLTHRFNTILHFGGEEQLEQLRRDTLSQANIRLVLCGGGKNVAYITPSANVEKAIPQLLYGAFVDAGQRLESTGIVLIHEEKMSQFLSHFIPAVKAMPVSARIDTPNVDAMGPLCSSTAWERFLRFQNIAAREADETLRWGKYIDNPGNGYFVSPGIHLMTPNKLKNSVYAPTPFFGPDVCLVPVKNNDHALECLSSIDCIRVLAFHSEYKEDMLHFRRQTSTPMVLWNQPTTTLNPLLPSVGRGIADDKYPLGVWFFLAGVYQQSYFSGSK